MSFNRAKSSAVDDCCHFTTSVSAHRPYGDIPTAILGKGRIPLYPVVTTGAQQTL
uniref:Uncharacterized protein n=1 Tax=Peronospora matthiolae TaxID=2874970 RepID=A0AAV1VKV6_9STRA